MRISFCLERYSHMKSKLKSLLFWALFFFMLICLLAVGVFFFINDDVSYQFYKGDLIYKVLCFTGYLFLLLYVVMSVMIIAGKLPEKVKKIEKGRYLGFLFVLLLAEILTISSYTYDFE